MTCNDNIIRNIVYERQTQTHANTTMAFTRSQAKKQQEQPQEKPQQRQQIHRKCKKTLPESTSTSTSRIPLTRSPIDFIDASIEWRKNKIKGENCTFEYIFL